MTDLNSEWCDFVPGEVTPEDCATLAKVLRRRDSRTKGWHGSSGRFGFQLTRTDERIQYYGDRDAVLKMLRTEVDYYRQTRIRATAKAKRTRELLLDKTVQRFLVAGQVGPSTRCLCCERVFTDPSSVDFGIGPECRKGFIEAVARHARTAQVLAEADEPDAPPAIQVLATKIKRLIAEDVSEDV